MITLYRPAYYTAPRAGSYVGKSTDEKPVNVENGATFTEVDTGETYRYDKQNQTWIKQ